MPSTAILVVELVVLFLGVAFAVEVLQRRLGPERLQTWMGGRPVVAALKGIAVGFVTPFCTYSAVPLLIGLRRAGVPTAGYVAFIVAAPVLDPVLFGALVLIVGIEVALAYLAIAFAAAMTLALVAQHVGIEHRLKPIPASNPASAARRPMPAMANPSTTTRAATTSCNAPDHSLWLGWRTESAVAARSAGALFRSFGPLLLAGVAIGLAIEAFVSPETAATVTGENSTFAIPVAAAIGTPLYFSTELFVPIADSLHRAGVGTGAIVALTIAGAGANIPEFVILARLAPTRLIAIFFGYVFAVATIGGVLAQAIS
jgi:hypothetical protein